MISGGNLLYYLLGFIQLFYNKSRSEVSLLLLVNTENYNESQNLTCKYLIQIQNYPNMRCNI